jgi:hypothetical protein
MPNRRARVNLWATKICDLAAGLNLAAMQATQY